MFIINSYAVAVIFCLVTMVCWGSWANAQKLGHKNWPFQLFYWDYSIGLLILTLIAAFTLGSFGVHGRAFIPDLLQGNHHSFFSALFGGIIFNLSNILLVAAIDIAGMAVAFPVGVGIALVFGVIINYIHIPIGNPYLLFIGVGAVTAAIIVDAFAYRQIETETKNTTKGLIIAIAAGILMGMFYRFVAAAMSLNFVTPVAGKYTPYTAVVVFTIGLVLSNFVWNTLVMKKPFTGKAVAYRDYFKQGNFKTHSIGWLGGIIWGIGTLLSFLAAGKAGYAISYGLGQGATMIAALWGVFIWREFKNANQLTKLLLKLMFILYIVGLGLIIIAKIY